MNATIIFVGPTLSAEEIKAILPDAWIHAPVQAGDIIKVLRLQPQRIIIIDGFYEIAASVWHKEILLALKLGVEVIGTASMGALRASELSSYGMLGMGKIYESYHRQELEDDDEVAVLHLARERNYQSLNEALVNIRATLIKARLQNIISGEQEQLLIKQAKSLFYPQRQYSRIIQQVEQLGYDFRPLIAWLPKHQVNLKAEDARNTLLWANTNLPTAAADFLLNHTLYLKRLILTINAAPFLMSYAWLPKIEQTTCRWARLYSKALPLVQEVAMALNLSYLLNEQEFSIQSTDKLPQVMTWLKLQQQREQIPNALINASNTILHLLFLAQDYNNNNDNWQILLTHFSQIIFILNRQFDQLKIYYRIEEINLYRLWTIKNALHLKHENELEALLIKNNIELNYFNQFLAQMARYRLAYKYFLGSPLLNGADLTPQNWLYEAFRLLVPYEQ